MVLGREQKMESGDQRGKSDSNAEGSVDRSSGSGASGSQEASKSQNDGENNKSEIIIVTDTVVKNMQPLEDRD